MSVPFLPQATAGLHITSSALVWVSLESRAGRVRRVSHLREPVQEGALEAALGRLVARMRPDTRLIATHLPTAHVRHVLLKDPPVKAPDEVMAWVRAEAAHRLPPGAVLEDFVLRVQPFVLPDGEAWMLVAMARRQAVEARIALLRSVGLQVSSLGSLPVAVGHTLAFTPRFVEGSSAVLAVHTGGHTLFLYRSGLLHEVGPLTSETAGSPRLWVVREAETALPDLLPPSLRERLQQEGSTLPGDHVRVPDGLLPAAALALTVCYPALDALNFLDPKAAAAPRQALERGRAIRVMKTVVGVALVSLLGSWLAQHWLEGRQESVGTERRRLAVHLDSLARTRDALQQLKQHLLQAEQWASARTNTAGLLDAVGRAVPEDVWLQVARMASEAGRTTIALTGVALDEGAVARYLDRLEQLPWTTDVHLVYTEARPAKQVYPREQVGAWILRCFEIRIEKRLPVAGTEEGG